MRIVLRHREKYITADVGNVSSSGLLIHATEPLETGSIVDFEFTLLDEALPYCGRAEVVRAETAITRSGKSHQIGLKFISIRHKRVGFSGWLRQAAHWQAVSLQMAVDALRYARAEMQGNVTEREFGQPGAGFKQPVLLIHGWLGTRGALLLVERRLKQQGFPVFSLNLGVPNINEIEDSARQVAIKVRRLSERLGLMRIDVIGHSMGGLIALWGLKKLDLARHVQRLIAIGVPFHGTYMAAVGMPLFLVWRKSLRQMIPQSAFLERLHEGPLPEGVKIYCLAARNDLLVPFKRATLEGAHNILIGGTHASLVTGQGAWAQILSILEGQEPFGPA